MIETSSRSAQIGNAVLDHHHHHYHHQHLYHTQSQLPNFTSNSSSPLILINHRIQDNLDINLSTIQHANPFEDHYNISLSSKNSELDQINDPRLTIKKTIGIFTPIILMTPRFKCIIVALFLFFLDVFPFFILNVYMWLYQINIREPIVLCLQCTLYTLLAKKQVKKKPNP